MPHTRRTPSSPTRRPGFTLIELLIAVVIIGVLAGAAMFRYWEAKNKTILGEMKADLRNFASVEEAYAADSGSYLSGTASNRGATAVALNGFVPSPGVEVVATATSNTGWSAIASHTATSKTCAIFIRVSAVSPATVEGQADCQ